MTNLTAEFTSEGFELTQDTRINGRYIDIQTFGISETAGLLQNRSIDNLNPMWVNIPISGTQNINSKTQQLNLTIPPNVVNPFGVPNTTNKQIKELYLFAIQQKEIFTIDLATNELIVPTYFYNNCVTGNTIRVFTDGVLPITSPISLAPNKTFYIIKKGINRVKIASTKDNALNDISLNLISAGNGTHKIARYFLLLVGQFNPEALIYPVSGTVNLRTQLVIDNLNVVQALNFSYTQANEIKDHNIDPNAHPYIQNNLKKYGIYINNNDFEIKGQNFYNNPIFHASVQDKMIVYMKPTDGKFYPALAGTGDISKYIGVADLTDNVVRFSGLFEINHSIPINQTIYLSDNIVGGITSNLTGVVIGRSLGNNKVLIQSTGSGGGGNGSVNYLNDLSDLNIVNRLNRNSVIYNSTTQKWENGFLNLNDLNDVNTESFIAGDNNLLSFDSNDNLWKPKALNLTDLHDTNITGLNSGQTIRWNGSKFINTNYGLTINSNNAIENVTFGSGFTVTPSGTGAVTITYSGTGSSNFTGLSDVPDSYPSDMGGIVAFNNYSNNSSSDKIVFISHDTPITNQVFNPSDGLIFSPVYKSVINIPLLSDMPFTFPLDKSRVFNLTKVYNQGATDIMDGALGYNETLMNVSGVGSTITGFVSGDNNYTNKINFGSGISGTFDSSTGVLSIASTVASGLSSVQSASNVYPGSYPLIYNNGSTSGVAKLKGISKSDGINIEMYDGNNSVTTNVNDAVYYKFSATNFTNIANTGGLGTVGGTTVLTPIRDINSINPKVRGIRGINGIAVKLEISGNNENIIIDGAVSGGGGGGVALGSNNNVTSSYGIGLTTGSGKIGYLSQGASSNQGIGFKSYDNQVGFIAEQCQYGAYYDHNVTGIYLGSDSKNPITLGYYGSATLSSLSGMSEGSFLYGNFNGAGQGIYFRNGGNLHKITTSNVGVIP